MKLLPVLLLFSLSAFSQNMEKDTIHLKEIVLTQGKKKKVKLKTIEWRAPCYYSEDMENTSEIITLLDGLPEGYLNSVSFYFNSYYTTKEQGKKFKDAAFELVFYEVKDNNTPGDEIYHTPVVIHIGKDFTGKFDADVSKCNIKCNRHIFAGLRCISGAMGKKQLSIGCLCNGQDKYITLVRPDASSPWVRRWECAALKMDVAIEVSR